MVTFGLLTLSIDPLHPQLTIFILQSIGCHDNMLPILSDIVNGILPFLDDEHPK